MSDKDLISIFKMFLFIYLILGSFGSFVFFEFRAIENDLKYIITQLEKNDE